MLNRSINSQHKLYSDNADPVWRLKMISSFCTLTLTNHFLQSNNENWEQCARNEIWFWVQLSRQLTSLNFFEYIYINFYYVHQMTYIFWKSLLLNRWLYLIWRALKFFLVSKSLSEGVKNIVIAKFIYAIFCLLYFFIKSFK